MKSFLFAIAIAAFPGIALRAQPVSPVAPPPSAAIQDNDHFGWADVLRVDPVYDMAAPVEQPCYEEMVPEGRDANQAGNRRGIATLVGAVVGGLFGNQFGKGSGRAAATVAGAVAGGAVGNAVASDDEDVQDARPRYRTTRHCPPGAPRRVVAYDVEYRYRGDVYSARMNFDPGDRLRVRVRVTPAE